MKKALMDGIGGRRPCFRYNNVSSVLPQGQKSIGKVKNVVTYRYDSATDENNLSYYTINFIFT